MQGSEHIGGVPAKPGQFEYQHIRNFVFSFLDINQHPLELRAALNVLAGKTFIGVFSGDEHIFVLCVFAQLVPLGIQAISIHLHSGGHTGIQITFSLFSHTRAHLLSLGYNQVLS